MWRRRIMCLLRLSLRLSWSSHILSHPIRQTGHPWLESEDNWTEWNEAPHMVIVIVTHKPNSTHLLRPLSSSSTSPSSSSNYTLDPTIFSLSTYVQIHWRLCFCFCCCWCCCCCCWMVVSPSDVCRRAIREEKSTNETHSGRQTHRTTTRTRTTQVVDDDQPTNSRDLINGRIWANYILAEEETGCEGREHKNQQLTCKNVLIGQVVANNEFVVIIPSHLSSHPIPSFVLFYIVQAFNYFVFIWSGGGW